MDPGLLHHTIIFHLHLIQGPFCGPALGSLPGLPNLQVDTCQQDGQASIVCMKTSKCVYKCEEECYSDLSVFQLAYNKNKKLLCCFPCLIAHFSPHLYMAESSFYEAKIVSNFGKERQTGAMSTNVTSVSPKIKFSILIVI